mmetsp:Transcript_30783/g.72786  ORF Transcript_30783/g.72786 Transcript_30783/m.72786 type:complete len:223 (+) Transcript_30783:579-1247(+)
MRPTVAPCIARRVAERSKHSQALHLLAFLEGRHRLPLARRPLHAALVEVVPRDHAHHLEGAVFDDEELAQGHAHEPPVHPRRRERLVDNPWIQLHDLFDWQREVFLKRFVCTQLLQVSPAENSFKRVVARAVDDNRKRAVLGVAEDFAADGLVVFETNHDRLQPDTLVELCHDMRRGVVPELVGRILFEERVVVPHAHEVRVRGCEHVGHDLGRHAAQDQRP